MRQYIGLGVLVALMFNSIGSLFAASSILRYAQSFSDENSLLICTGSAYKWISLSTFELTGKLEYVAPPENAPSTISEIKCSYAYLAEPNPDTTWAVIHSQFTVPFKSSITINNFSAVYAVARHKLALSRAPPTFS